MRWILPSILLTVGFWAHADISYETCTSENDYFEKGLAPGENLDFSGECSISSFLEPKEFDQLDQIAKNLDLPPECIYASMAAAPVTGKYGACAAGDSDIPKKYKKRPCISKGYHFLTYASFIQSMRCLGIDPRELFLLIHYESHFQVNIGSASGAWGVGQLTSVAVSMNAARHRADLYLSRKECEPLKKALMTRLPSANACAWITPPLNPTQNFLQVGMLYQALKNIAQRQLLSSPLFKRFSAKERRQVAVDLARYMYNGGDVAITAAFKAFESENEAMSYSVFRDAFSGFLAENYEASYLNPRLNENMSEEEREAEIERAQKALEAKRKEVSLFAKGVANCAHGFARLGLKCGG